MGNKKDTILSKLFHRHRVEVRMERQEKARKERLRETCKSTQEFDLKWEQEQQERKNAIDILLDPTPFRESCPNEIEIRKICPTCNTVRTQAHNNGWVCECPKKVCWSQFG